MQGLINNICRTITQNDGQFTCTERNFVYLGTKSARNGSFNKDEKEKFRGLIEVCSMLLIICLTIMQNGRHFTTPYANIHDGDLKLKYNIDQI